MNKTYNRALVCRVVFNGAADIPSMRGDVLYDAGIGWCVLTDEDKIVGLNPDWKPVYHESYKISAREID